jgi:hypothetical protein
MLVGVAHQRFQRLQVPLGQAGTRIFRLRPSQRLDLEVRPVSGADIDELVANLNRTPSRKLASEASANAP